MTLSIVIATKDRASSLGRALASLGGQADAPPFDVVVADNGSTDTTAEVIERQAATGAYPLHRVYVPAPNRGAARNRGVAATRGELVVFVDDDVVLPRGFLAAHAREHETSPAVTVTGPIVNVAAPSDEVKPTVANASRAFFCTCNASLRRTAFEAAGGFDEAFDLYGWEDTELGIRLRRNGLRRVFSWAAYLLHIKPPGAETLANAARRATEKGRMAARLVRKHPTLRTRLATGAYSANLMRAALVTPPWSLGLYAALAEAGNVPAPLRNFARAQFLDGSYARELRAGLRRR